MQEMHTIAIDDPERVRLSVCHVGSYARWRYLVLTIFIRPPHSRKTDRQNTTNKYH